MPFRIFLRTACLLVTAVLALARVAAAHEAGAGNSVSLLRDTEIEGDIRTMMTPIWKAAGLDPDAVHVYLVADDSINSFVAGGQNIFINSGLVLHAKTPNQLIGVLAHETGHIAGGHLYKGAEAMHNASIEEIIAMAAGVAATVAARGSDGGGALLGAAGRRPARLSAVLGDPGSDRRPCRDELSRRDPSIGARTAAVFRKICRPRNC